MMLFIYDCVNTAIFVVLTYIFGGIFFDKRNITTSMNILSLLIWMIAEIVVVSLFADIFIIKAIITVVIMICASHFIYSGGIGKKIILSILEYSLFLSFDFFVYLISINVSSYVYIFDIDNSITSIYCGTASELLFLLAIIALHAFFRKEKHPLGNGSEYIKFSIFPILSLSMIIAVGYSTNRRVLTTPEINFYLYLAIIFLVANIYMYWILHIDTENKILNEKYSMFEIYAEDLTNLYEQIREEHREIAEIEHEYKNHLTVISSLAMAEKTQELQEYLKNTKTARVTADVVDTGNNIVSALFNAKYVESIRKGIQVRFSINNLQGLTIEDTDLVILLSNLFNNAIEACENIQTEKIIDIKITKQENMLFISFTNTLDEKNGFDNFTLSTTKADKSRHGYGLKNIRHIVDAYKGQMDIIPAVERFTVRIVITDTIIH